MNASPLILLARIGHLDLLTALAETVCYPRAVLAELEAGSSRDRAAEIVAANPDLVPVADAKLPERLRLWDLGPGESQVLAYAMAQPEHEAVLDDRAARNCARALGIPYLGTLGIVVSARHRRLIPAARPLVDALVAEGIRLKPSVTAEALAMVDE